MSLKGPVEAKGPGTEDTGHMPSESGDRGKKT